MEGVGGMSNTVKWDWDWLEFFIDLDYCLNIWRDTWEYILSFEVVDK